MIDHISLNVTDYEKSKAFYTRALAPIGYALVMEVPGEVTASGLAVAGFGAQGKPDLWIAKGVPGSPPAHVAFAAKSRDVVEAFYRAALAAGGEDNGAPGIRDVYHPTYYGAFVRDPDGHNIEAVCHTG